MNEEKRIPKDCSITSSELEDRKQNGLAIFTQIVDTNREQNILKQENWNIFIDYILSNVIFTDNIIAQSIELLDYLRECISECTEKRTISLNDKHFVNRGCLEFFLQFGFVQLDNDLVILEPNESINIINTASTTIFKRIELLQLKQQLQSLWTQCILLMTQHPDYQSQTILPQILSYDLSTNYSQYITILDKLVPISSDCIIAGNESFAIEILRRLGFNILLIQHLDVENEVIWSILCDIYAFVNKIERIKDSIYKNENNIETKGVTDFEAILKQEASERMYEELLSPYNWDNLIRCICLNMHRDTNEERKRRLNSFKHIAEKALKEEKYRRIDTSKTATRKMCDIYGSAAYLRALGFIKQANSEIVYLRAPKHAVLNVAIACIDHKIRVMNKLDELHKLWQDMISMMRNNIINDSNNTDLLQTLSMMDVSNVDGPAYDEMRMHVMDITQLNSNNNYNNSDIAQLMLERLGINYNLAQNSNSMNLVNNFYCEIQNIEQFKMDRDEVNMMASAARKRLSIRFVLNDLWRTCVEFMHKHEIFRLQSFVIRDIETKDFTKREDYEWLLNAIRSVGELKIYSCDLRAAQQILRHLNFQLPQKLEEDKQNILNYVVNVYQKVEEIEVKFIRISADDKKKDDIEENAMRDHDFRIAAEETPAEERKEEEKEMKREIEEKKEILEINSKIQREEELYHGSLVLRLNADIKTEIKCGDNILTCNHVLKILKSLHFVDSLKLNFVSGQNELVEYFTLKHTTILEDFIHLKSYHDDELHQICENWGLKCRYDLYCSQLQRYHGEEKWITNDEETDFIFYIETMDSIHCYLYHLFDLGLRDQNAADLLMIDEEQELSDAEDSDSFVFLDEKYNLDEEPKKKVSHKNSQKKSLLPLLSVQSQNFKKHKAAKFQFQGGYDESWTFIDGMREYLMMQGMTRYQVQYMICEMQKQDYDSDALLDDIEDYDSSFIEQIICGAQHLETLLKYIHFTKLTDKSFSVGFRFYYWEYYRHKDRVFEAEYFQNKNFHSGYQTHELFVAPKFNNIKEEILYNSVCSISLREYNKSLVKAQRYLSLDSIKQIAACENVFLHYDIWDSEPLLEAHLLAVTLYCDWSDLCTAFSATFRKKHAYEHITLVVNRNSDFAHWSQRLRETVELYGKRGWEKRDFDEEKWNLEHDRIRGPFYCGMDQMMVLPEFNIRLCAPTSTSSSFSVATSFAGDEGIIITLNNNGHWHSDNLRIWDCSWLSGFQGEDEKLIMGGFYTIRIQAIQEMCTFNADNYETYFMPAFYFDCMLTGISMLRQTPNITKWHKTILNHLIFKSYDEVRMRCKYDAYICDTFEAYKNHRAHTVINLHQIEIYFSKLKDLLIETLCSQKWECEVCFSRGNSIHCSRCWMCTATNLPSMRGVNNVLKLSALEQFPNLQHIVLYTTSGTGQHEYVFDCTKLINNLITYASSESHVATNNAFVIEIKATHRYDVDQQMNITHKELSWLAHEWQQYGDNFKSFLKSFNPKSNITLLHTENRGASVYKEDTLYIEIYQ